MNDKRREGHTMGAPKLSSAQKAAIILLSLGDETSAEVFKAMHPDEIRTLSQTISKLGHLDQSEVTAVLEEFEGLIDAAEHSVHGDYNIAKSLLDKAFENESSDFMEEVGLQKKASIDCLDIVDSKSLATFLTEEHPQTIALIMAHLPPTKFAETLELIPSSMHADILRRIAHLDFSSTEVLGELNSILKSELNIIENQQQQLGGPQQVAHTLNAMPKSMQDAILQSLNQQNPELAYQVTELMFTFEDLVKINNQGMQELLKATKSEQWLLALRNASAPIKEHIFTNMSERRRDILQDDMEDMGPVKLEDIKAAQADIVKSARDLEAQGVIAIVHNPHEKYI